MTFPLTLILMPWGRVGSNMILDVITHFHMVDVHNEELTRIKTMYAEEPGAVIGAHQSNWLAQHGTRATLTLPTVINHAALSTVDPQSFVDWINRESPQIITLDRLDDLSVALSSARVTAWVAEGMARNERRNWAIKSDVDFLPVINPETVRKNLQNVIEGRKMMHRLLGNRDHLALNYEDLICDFNGCMADILRRVGVPRKSFRVTSRKFGGSDLRKIVANPHDFADIVAEHTGQTVLFI